ncbi:glycoside hydrolase family 15 protein [Parvularcula dongshanensis]|uniref:GH15 family glucan-1,4-alpha-glucosidase n=1 Tax=Parvularcula dongshanensis TaxID=1173995 RepID=A0A840I6K2_9PROT|nr:glycoside hydrolase family 15 protein [Parvularcula dongshanensis]MBB4659881.1 GH15 family glucan-1,4-alpha-glucosidase [Parvularcula dongshanensis]
MLGIEDHGVIGDLRTAALVGTDGAIDFLCWPRLDSPSVFARLLDHEKGGAFEISPQLEDTRCQQLYLPDTNVLLTRHLAEEGVSEISDFMAIGDEDGGQRMVRRVKAIRREIRFDVRCAPRFDYARAEAKVTREDGAVIFASTGDDATRLRLRASVPLSAGNGEATTTFTLRPGEAATFVLEDGGLALGGCSSVESYTAEAFKRTTNYWRDWVSRSTYRGRWRPEVMRSALVLKLLTSAEYGSVSAAVTFGLPEAPGAGRNWDYRYAWIRDSAFTMYAFLRLGFYEEATAYQVWLRGLKVEGPPGPLPLLFTLDGSPAPAEQELDHLSGYRGSRPVRTGNAAAGQLQLDIYGELMDAIYLSDKYTNPIWSADWQYLSQMMDWLAENWNQPDEGIWEPRSGRQHTLHSRVMCWVAFDRAVRLANKRGIPAPIERWRRERDAIYEDVHENFWNEELKAFVQTKGGYALDAACLLMPLVRFVSATDPKWLSTLQAVKTHLMDDSLVYRYSADTTEDGLDGLEGTFNMCSFWYVECLARAGDLAQARFLFDKMLGYANPLGLFAEETGPAGEPLGNFPQAFTHLALISAAFTLNRMLGD